jgi:CheY-like chemotaxis protein
MSDAPLQFVDEHTDLSSPDDGTWTVLVVDDEAEIHVVTGLALEGMRFANSGLKFLHAFSGAEAKTMLREHPEVALILLDVVMETDQAGLDVVEFVRNELKNPFVRIILRTGQPGQAPELEVITRYDINDYRHKTELTRERLYTTVFTALSTYRDLTALDANRRGLRKVIEATATLFEVDSMERFAEGVLEQLIALLFLRRDALMLHATGIAASDNGSALAVIAGTGRYAGLSGRDAALVLPADVLQRIEASRSGPDMVFGSNYFLRRQVDSISGEWVFYVAADLPLGEPDRELIELYCRNVALARRHLLLRQQSGDV